MPSDLMNKYQLPLIRDYHGVPGAVGKIPTKCHCDDQDSEDCEA